jgi:hypothetical protein
MVTDAQIGQFQAVLKQARSLPASAALRKPPVQEFKRFVSEAEELLSNLVDGLVELGGGLGEAEAVLEDDSLDDIGQQFMAV